MAQDEIISMTPSVQQLESIVDGLNRCHVRASAREFLRVWIRDWTAHKLEQAKHDLEDIRCECCGYMTYQHEHMGCICAAYEMRKQK